MTNTPTPSAPRAPGADRATHPALIVVTPTPSRPRPAPDCPPPIIHPRLLTDLNRRLDRAMRKKDREARADLPRLLAIADWLASLDCTLPTRNARARAHAAARYLGVSHA